tara:strand:- start:19233 stop:19829 length:597 start_codon:yes stop_codon:yes gene_type:complete
MSSLYLYWIHHKNHSDVTREGYIGVSGDPSRRFKEHTSRKDNIHLHNALTAYGEDIVFKVLALGERAYILQLEHSLRPTKQVGWNIAVGGCIPPDQTGFHMPKSMCSETSIRVKAFRNTAEGRLAYKDVNLGRICTDKTRSKIAKTLTKFWRTPDGVFEGIHEVLSFYNLKSQSSVYRRHNAVKGKYKDWFIEEKVND